MPSPRPILVSGLFPELNDHLLELLRSLAPDDWHRPTVCSEWAVKDIASHLLEGSRRRLSMMRDGYYPPGPPPGVDSYEALVGFLNRLNAEWTRATRRLSPRVLIALLEWAGPQLHELFAGLDPFARAMFPVAWAGERESLNWMDIAREFTEKWHHQQQIIHAVGAASPIMTARLYGPVLDAFLRALPFTYEAVDAEEGTGVRVVITGEAGGVWSLVRRGGAWSLVEALDGPPDATVTIPQEDAWLAFTKRMDGHKKRERFPAINLEGDAELGGVALEMVSIMA